MSGSEPCKVYLKHVRTGIKVWCCKDCGHDGMHVTVAGLEWMPTVPHPKPSA